ncbi:MAG: RES domain-containing protein [Kiritimatiellae bacterium]|nr:RES domain-containing protein [Kiritimatiellia bacterium]
MLDLGLFAYRESSILASIMQTMFQQHPEYVAVCKRIERLQSACRSWKGYVYRNTSPKYGNKVDILSGRGSQKYGGRWNSAGSFSAVYASLTPQLAMEEAFAHFHYYQLPIHAAMPRLFVAISVSLRHVLDLTGGEIRNRLRVSSDHMTQEDWRKAQEQGKEALT